MNPVAVFQLKESSLEIVKNYRVPDLQVKF